MATRFIGVKAHDLGKIWGYIKGQGVFDLAIESKEIIIVHELFRHVFITTLLSISTHESC
jgi:hypothetical protein